VNCKAGYFRSRRYFGLESGGHSGRTAMGLPPSCTVGAAELDSPPASGKTALFSIAMEFDCFSPALPVVTGEVVQFVSGFAFDCVEVWARAGPATNDPMKIAAATRIVFSPVANDCFPGRHGRTFRHDDRSLARAICRFSPVRPQGRSRDRWSAGRSRETAGIWPGQDAASRCRAGSRQPKAF
jgi:hypothetical protein